MDQRRFNMMQLYSREEQGRNEASQELQRMRLAETRARQEVPRSEFERIESEKPLAEEAFQHGNLIPFLEFRENQARARWEEQVELVKNRYTHAKLQADLKKAFGEKNAREHAFKIQRAILEHPDILQLLRKGQPIRREGNRIVVGPHVLLAMIKAAKLRRQFHDDLVAGTKRPPTHNVFSRLFAPLHGQAVRKAA